MLDLSIVIPAYNEEATVAAVVADHSAVARRISRSFEIIVCNDGSIDATGRALAAARESTRELTVLENKENAGIPATMKRLYDLARGEWIYFGPADGQVPASALERMWAARDGAALVVGQRKPRRDPATRVIVAELYSAYLRLVFRLPVHDVDSVKLYRAADLHSLTVRSSSNFFEAEILIALCRRRHVVREVLVEHRPRVAGRAKGVTARSAALAIADLVRFSLSDLTRGARS